MASDAPARPSALGREAMVVANHPAVSSAGLGSLRAGGNAIDATLVMAAVSWIVLPGQCGVGGDAFAVVREPDGRVWTVGASGFGPDGGTPGFYRDLDLRSVPLSGALGVAAPGAIAAHYGDPRGRRHPIVGRAVGAWRSPWRSGASRARPRRLPTSSSTASGCAPTTGTAAMFLPGGRVPRVGQLLTYPELAQSLRSLAREPESFYTGALAEEAVAALTAAGAPFSGDEWVASGIPLVGPAITQRYGSVMVHETPPPSSGWMLLQEAALCDGELAGLPWLGAEAVDLLARVARQAFRDRFARCGSDTDTWRELLEPAAVASARAGLSENDLTPSGVGGDGDTTSTVVVDGEGRAVSFHPVAWHLHSART